MVGFEGLKKASNVKSDGLPHPSPQSQPQSSPKPIEEAGYTVCCPECGSVKVWRDGLRYVKGGAVQRWLCKLCGYRFSEPKVKVNVHAKPLKNFKVVSEPCNVNPSSGGSAKVGFYDSPLPFSEDVFPHNPSSSILTLRKDLKASIPNIRKRRVCVWNEQAKNSAKAVKALSMPNCQTQKWDAGATETVSKTDVKGKILQYAWWMKKQGYSDVTIRVNCSALKTLVARGANLDVPETVKEVIAKQKWSESRKHSVIAAYSLYVKMNGLSWEKPLCHVTRRLPFIPTEQELDSLIAACGRKTSVYLQLLKETAMRCGEAVRLKWTDIDFERRVITLNAPEKGCNPRVWKVSQKLIDMLNRLPKKNEYVFGGTSVSSLKSSFWKSRRRAAFKLQNPRLNNIGFHTFRHWKATTLYHQTKDPLYVKEFLGHKKLDSTLLYIQLEQALYGEDNGEFHVKTAKTPEEIKALLEAGFEYVCQKDDLLFFRKRK